MSRTRLTGEARTRGWRVALVAPTALLLLLWGAPARGQNLVRPMQIELPSEAGRTVALENDLFSLTKKSDRWYTNGVHAAWHFKPREGPIGAETIEQLGRRLFAPETCPQVFTPGEADNCRVTVTYGLGQSMYTPRNLEDRGPQLQDRSWAGWLYVGSGITHTDGHHHQSVAYKMGPTGPLSLAKEAQTYVHRWISHSPKPQGWGNQLRPRLGIQLSYLHTWFYDLADRVGVNLGAGGTLGNIRTMARLSFGLAWSPTPDGRRRFQPGTLDEGEFLIPDFAAASTSMLENLMRTVLYANVQATSVGYNAFLQGDTFAGRPDIQRIRNVQTATVGLTIPLPWGTAERYKLGFAYKVRSPEFTSALVDGRDAYQKWGVLSLTWISL